MQKRVSLIGLFLLSVLFIGCSTTYVNKDIVGKRFPSCSGSDLNDEERKMPEYFEGSEVVLLLGYKQDSQFDIDRWLIGLDMTDTDVKVYEIPTIQGLFPRMFSTKIDEGMRSGIPKELWGGVITVYSDGSMIQEFTGNENPNNARVVLLDESSEIVYFHDRGFSVNALNKLKNTLNGLKNN